MNRVTAGLFRGSVSSSESENLMCIVENGFGNIVLSQVFNVHFLLMSADIATIWALHFSATDKAPCFATFGGPFGPSFVRVIIEYFVRLIV